MQRHPDSDIGQDFFKKRHLLTVIVLGVAKHTTNHHFVTVPSIITQQPVLLRKGIATLIYSQISTKHSTRKNPLWEFHRRINNSATTQK